MKKKEFDDLLVKMAERIDAILEKTQPPHFDSFVKEVFQKFELVLSGVGPEFDELIPLNLNFEPIDPNSYIRKFLELWLCNALSEQFVIKFGPSAKTILVTVDAEEREFDVEVHSSFDDNDNDEDESDVPSESDKEVLN